MASAHKRSEEILEILTQACARNELVILSTPYLRFESSFVALADGELQVAATMSRDDATFGLRSDQLKIRFPSGLGFMEAAVKLLGLGLHGGRRTLRLSVPRQIQENDHRTEYRVERVGRVTVTYGTPKGEISLASLVDLSTGGARIHAQRDLNTSSFQPGSILLLSIPLTEDIQIEARGEVVHLGPRSLGLKFAPQLPEEVQAPLSRWVFQRREEDLERLAQRLDLVQQGERRIRLGDAPQAGILLVSGDPDLEAVLREVLRPLQPLTRIAPSAQALKDALAGNPPLAVFHLDGAGLDQRRRFKALVELATGRVPVMLLGTQVDSAALFELSGEWKATTALAWNPARGPFLLRLVQGVIRRSAQGGASPLAPAELQ